MFQEWFPSNFSKVLVLSGLIISSAAAEVTLPPLLREVQQQYQKSAGIEARFTQVTDVKATKHVKKAKGRIWIKRPNKLRWETLEPDPNILISDGKTFWFYTPPFDQGERGQVIIRKSAQVQTQFLNALLGGTFEFGKDSISIEDRMRGEFLLRPRPGTAGDVSTAQVRIDPMKHIITQVVLTHSSGNKTEINLEEIKLPSKLEDSLFRYTPDKNTDKIVE